VLDLKLIEQLAERINSLLPADTRVLHEDFKANVRALLETVLNRMELVTREEFDAQRALLENTRAKLERIERELAALEQGAPPS
jgi:ubiquinone biosynthesis accessory factor UbiK